MLICVAVELALLRACEKVLCARVVNVAAEEGLPQHSVQVVLEVRATAVRACFVCPHLQARTALAFTAFFARSQKDTAKGAATPLSETEAKVERGPPEQRRMDAAPCRVVWHPLGPSAEALEQPPTVEQDGTSSPQRMDARAPQRVEWTPSAPASSDTAAIEPVEDGTTPSPSRRVFRVHRI
jgi:hypothetical protein